jgi:hypothetical protein
MTLEQISIKEMVETLTGTSCSQLYPEKLSSSYTMNVLDKCLTNRNFLILIELNTEEEGNSDGELSKSVYLRNSEAQIAYVLMEITEDESDEEASRTLQLSRVKVQGRDKAEFDDSDTETTNFIQEMQISETDIQDRIYRITISYFNNKYQHFPLWVQIPCERDNFYYVTNHLCFFNASNSILIIVFIFLLQLRFL